MPAFEFRKNSSLKRWTIIAPRRAKRPDIANGTEPACPFCPEQLDQEPEVYSVKGDIKEDKWEIKVITNKYPFADTHELIIHTPEHDLPLAMQSQDHLKKVIEVYKNRFNEHHHKGQVFIFHNHGEKAGESIPHSHTQLAVLPQDVYLDAPPLSSIESDLSTGLETPHLMIICPLTSQWPDEVWITPKARGRYFGEITEHEVEDLANALSSLVRMYDLRYKKDFPFNFYIYPGNDWYLRIIPRNKVLGGLEVGTGVFVNTQDPKETMKFIKDHFVPSDDQTIPEVDYDYWV